MDRSAWKQTEVDDWPERADEADTAVIRPVDDSGPSGLSRAAIGGRVVIGIAVLVVVQQTILIALWFSRYVNDDWALLWAAAESWGRLRPEQPNFWGQTYGTTLESIPTQLLHAVGIGYPLALPIVLTAVQLATWWIPAAAAWRRGRRFLAVIAVAMPALLSTEYVVSASVYGAAAGRVAGAVVLAVVVLFPDRIRWLAAAAALSAVAFLMDTSSLLATAPACVYGLVRCIPAARERGPRRTAITFLAAVTPVAGWMLFTSWWYARHPGDDLHPAAVFDPTWSTLQDNVEHPDRMFGPYALELWRSPVPLVLVTIGLAVVLIVQRKGAGLAALLTLILVVVVVLTLPKTYDDLGTVYFLAARLFLLLPVALWFIATCADPWPLAERWQRHLALGLVALLALTASYRVITWPSRGAVMQAEAVAPDAGFAQMPVDQLMDTCDRVAKAAKATGADVAIFSDNISAYGCAALIGPSVTTVFPDYDRRRWVLEDLDRPRSTQKVLYVGDPPGDCHNDGENCVAVDTGIVTMDLNGRSPIQLIRDMGLVVRPF